MPAIPYFNENNKRVPSVTTINDNLGWGKMGMVYRAWEKGMEGVNYKDIWMAEADKGTCAHKMIECDLRGKDFDPTEFPQDIYKAALILFKGYQEWKKDYKFETIATELSLVSEKYQFGGTIDIGIVKRKRAIVDVKTSKAIYETHICQISAYGRLWNEIHPDKKIQAYHLLHLDKQDPNNPAFAYYWWPPQHQKIKTGWKVFLLLRQLHDLKGKLK